MKASRFFFYGTLLAASDTAMARWLGPRILETRRADVPGRLLAIPSPGGWYPALVAGRGGERARGTLCTVTLGPGDLARLDRYEGREYRRETARARAPTGGRLQAQLYRWRAPLPGGAEPIRGGDFLAWLAQTGRRPFSGG